MNEEKINQILKNQATILLAIYNKEDAHTMKNVLERTVETGKLLKRTNSKRIKEQTRKFFGCGKQILVKDGKGQHVSFCGCTYKGLHLCDECQRANDALGRKDDE